VDDKNKRTTSQTVDRGHRMGPQAILQEQSVVRRWRLIEYKKHWIGLSTGVGVSGCTKSYVSVYQCVCVLLFADKTCVKCVVNSSRRSFRTWTPLARSSPTRRNWSPSSFVSLYLSTCSAPCSGSIYDGQSHKLWAYNHQLNFACTVYHPVHQRHKLSCFEHTCPSPHAETTGCR